MTKMKTKQNIIFISDLHLGSGKSNDFHATFQLHRLFNYAAKNATELVIVGDFLELLQSELTEVYIQHHPIFVHLFALAREISVRYVIGNHDALTAIDFRPDGKSWFLGSPILITPEYENRELKIFSAHGHQYSLFNQCDDILDISEGSSPGDRIARVIGWLEQHLHHKVDNVLEKVYLDYKFLLRKILRETKNQAKLVTPAHPLYEKFGGDYSEYECGALSVLRSDRHSLVIFGHTHQALLKTFKKEHDGVNGIYANAGSWVGEDFLKNPPVFVEVNAEIVKLINAETFEVFASAKRS